MELAGGFEPPTFWVRFTPLAIAFTCESRMTSGFAPIVGCSGRNADFCLIGHHLVQVTGQLSIVSNLLLKGKGGATAIWVG